MIRQKTLNRTSELQNEKKPGNSQHSLESTYSKNETKREKRVKNVTKTAPHIRVQSGVLQIEFIFYFIFNNDQCRHNSSATQKLKVRYIYI